ncbi:MAG: hypothetical protein ACRDT4_01100 [Micromonosporaceae bacterium]
MSRSPAGSSAPADLPAGAADQTTGGHAPTAAPSADGPGQGSTDAARTAAFREPAVAQGLIVGGLVGFTTSAIGMLLVGWVRRRL